MKKLTIIFLMVLFLSACSNGTNFEVRNQTEEDRLTFKEEHEAYNNTYRDDGDPHLNIYIPENNKVIEINFDEFVQFFDSGTGVFFFSRPTCPWCRQILPTFLQVAEDENMYVLYYDVDYDRETHNQNYVTILERLHDYLPVNDRDQDPEDPDFDPEMKRVTVPHIFVVQSGEVVDHIMLNRHQLLIDEDMNGLHDLLQDMFNKIQ